MSDREAAFANLTPKKRELLELLLREDEIGSKFNFDPSTAKR